VGARKVRKVQVMLCEKIQKRGVTQYIYANNDYAGFSPATAELFRSLCRAKGIETLPDSDWRRKTSARILRAAKSLSSRSKTASVFAEVSGLRVIRDEEGRVGVFHLSLVALPRWRRRRSSSSPSSPRRHALPHRRQPQAHRLARAG
jgi:hypothetical protein